MYSYKSYRNLDTVYVEISYNGKLILTRTFSGTNYTEESAKSTIKFEADNFGFSVNGKLYPTTSKSNVSTPTPTPTPTKNPETESTSDFNTPDVSSALKTKDELDSKITELQEVGLPGVKDVPKTLYKNLIEPKLLTPRQATKKLLMLQGQSYSIPITEERAQLIIYGKIYYKNGELYDNDKKDPACVSKPDDDDYQPPLDKDHPMWKKIEEMFKDLKTKLIQLGIKMGEFLLAIPAAIINIATSLIALVSGAIVMPFGAGLPTAISAVQTMMATIKDLQAKTAALLPLIDIVDIIALVLPKESQAIIAQINIIYAVILGILTALTAIIGLLGKVTSLLGKADKKMKSQKLKVKVKAEPTIIKSGEKSLLSTETTGGDWQYTYQWYVSNSSGYKTIISKDEEIEVDPKSTTIYTCKVIDGTSSMKESSTIVIVR